MHTNVHVFLSCYFFLSRATRQAERKPILIHGDVRPTVLLYAGLCEAWHNACGRVRTNFKAH